VYSGKIVKKDVKKLYLEIEVDLTINNCLSFIVKHLKIVIDNLNTRYHYPEYM